MFRLRYLLAIFVIFSISFTSLNSFADDNNEHILSAQAQAILEAKCTNCHAKNGEEEKLFDDQNNFLSTNKGIVEDSLEYVESGDMPPKRKVSEEDLLSEDEKKVLVAEFGELLKNTTQNKNQKSRATLTVQELVDLAEQDYSKRNSTDAAFGQYIYIKDLDSRKAQQLLNFVLNSVSLSRELFQVELLNKNEQNNVHLFRFDLRNLGALAANKWDDVTQDNYPFLGSVKGNLNLEVLDGKWLIANLLKEPIYRELLPLPENVTEFFSEQINNANFQAQSGMMSMIGFNHSGVSVEANRATQRFVTSDGALHSSIDFGDTSSNDKNIFLNPLPQNIGLSDTELGFHQADGGEYILHLPNGLFWYAISNADGSFINEAPTNVVLDPERGQITTAQGCINCHGDVGLRAKDDEVLNFYTELNKKENDVSDEDQELLEKIYNQKKWIEGLKKDNELYFSSLDQIVEKGFHFKDAFFQVVDQYNALVDFEEIAWKLGFEDGFDVTGREAKFLVKLARSGKLKRAQFENDFNSLLTTAEAKKGKKEEDFVEQETVNLNLFSSKIRVKEDSKINYETNTICSKDNCQDITGAPITSVSIEHLGNHLVYSDKDGNVAFKDIRTGNRIEESGFDFKSTSVKFSPVKSGILALYENSKDRVIIYNLKTNSIVKIFDAKMEGAFTDLDFSPDGKFIITNGIDLSIIFNFDGILVHKTYSFEPKNGLAMKSVMYPNSKDTMALLFGGGVQKGVFEEDGFSELDYYTSNITDLISIPNSRRFAYVRSKIDDDVYVVDPYQEKAVKIMDQISEEASLNLVASGSGEFLASGGETGLITLWDLKNLKRIGIIDSEHSLKAEEKINSLSLSYTGEYLAAGSEDGRLMLFKVFDENAEDQEKIEITNDDRAFEEEETSNGFSRD